MKRVIVLIALMLLCATVSHANQAEDKKFYEKEFKRLTNLRQEAANQILRVDGIIKYIKKCEKKAAKEKLDKIEKKGKK